MSSFAVNLLDPDVFTWNSGGGGIAQPQTNKQKPVSYGGALYVVTFRSQPSGAGDLALYAAKSTDDGVTWVLQDMAGSPAFWDFEIGSYSDSVIGYNVEVKPGTSELWVVYVPASEDPSYPVSVVVSIFDMATDTWGSTSTTTPVLPLKTDGSLAPIFDIYACFREDNGRLYVGGGFFLSGPDSLGNESYRNGYTYLDTIGGAWAAPVEIPDQPAVPGGGSDIYPDFTYCGLLPGSDGRVHAILRMTDVDPPVEPLNTFHYLVDDGAGSPGASPELVYEVSPGGCSGQLQVSSLQSGQEQLIIQIAYDDGVDFFFVWVYADSADSPVWNNTPEELNSGLNLGIGRDVDGSVYLFFSDGINVFSSLWNGAGFDSPENIYTITTVDPVSIPSCGGVASIGVAFRGPGNPSGNLFSTPGVALFSGSPAPPTPVTPPAPEHPLAKPIFKCPNFWDFCLGTLHAQESGIKFPPPFTTPADWVPPACYDPGQPWLQIPSQGRELYQLGSLALPAPGSGDQLLFSYRVPAGYYAVLYEIYQDYTEPFTSTASQLIWRVRLNRRWIKDMGSMDYALGSLNGFKCLDDRIIADSGWVISYFVNVPSTSPLVGGRVLAGLRGWVYPYGV